VAFTTLTPDDPQQRRTGTATADIDYGAPLRIEDLVHEDRVHRLIYTDRSIFEAEQRNIFERVWIYVGHESEVPNHGDFKTSQIGRQPVILTRDDTGAINVLINRCTHRGSLICREDRGNAGFFRCPYHAWTFKTNGELIGVPRRQRFPDEFDAADFNAVHVPRVEIYRGLIFASFNRDVEPLVDFLAQARRDIDTILDLSVEGTVRLTAGPNRHRYRGNWKFQAENGVDGYHAMYLHETFFAIQKRRSDSVRLGPRDESAGWSQAYSNGHVVLTRNHPPEDIARVCAEHPEYYQALERKRGADRIAELLREIHLYIFPNLFMTMNQIRIVHPVTPEETIVKMDPFYLDGAPEALNEKRLREHQQGFTPGGFIVPDDYAAFECVQEGMNATTVPWLWFLRGIHDESLLPDGSRKGSPTDETTQRGMYRMYRALMAAGAPA
jgi:benzoate/toluate 1,2-dioxygenase subunit alpha